MHQSLSSLKPGAGCSSRAKLAEPSGGRFPLSASRVFWQRRLMIPGLGLELLLSLSIELTLGKEHHDANSHSLEQRTGYDPEASA